MTTAEIIRLPTAATLLASAHHLQSDQSRAISLAWEHIQRAQRHLAAGNKDAAGRYLHHAATVLERGS